MSKLNYMCPECGSGYTYHYLELAVIDELPVEVPCYCNNCKSHYKLTTDLDTYKSSFKPEEALTIYKEDDLTFDGKNRIYCFVSPKGLPPVNKEAFTVENHKAYDPESHNINRTIPVIHVSSKRANPTEFHPKGYPILSAYVHLNGTGEACGIDIHKAGFGYSKLKGFSKEEASDLAMRMLTVFYSKPYKWLVTDNEILDIKDVKL